MSSTILPTLTPQGILLGIVTFLAFIWLAPDFKDESRFGRYYAGAIAGVLVAYALSLH